MQKEIWSSFPWPQKAAGTGLERQDVCLWQRLVAELRLRHWSFLIGAGNKRFDYRF
jgi:hypothetical protein